MSREKAMERHLDHVDCIEVHVLHHNQEVVKVVVECARCDEIIETLWAKDEIDTGRTRQVALEPDAIRYRINKMRTGGLSMSEIIFQLGMDGVQLQHMLYLVLQLMRDEEREEVKKFVCPQCGAKHDRGWFPPGVKNSYRCLKCGYVGPSAEEPIPYTPAVRTVLPGGSSESFDEDNFMNLLVDGEVDEDEIDEWVSKWHNTDGSGTLHDYLGMTWGEYKRWARNPGCLGDLAEARRGGRNENEGVEHAVIHIMTVWQCGCCSTPFAILADEKPVCPRCGRVG